MRPWKVSQMRFVKTIHFMRADKDFYILHYTASKFRLIPYLIDFFMLCKQDGVSQKRIQKMFFKYL